MKPRPLRHLPFTPRIIWICRPRFLLISGGWGWWWWEGGWLEGVLWVGVESVNELYRFSTSSLSKTVHNALLLLYGRILFLIWNGRFLGGLGRMSRLTIYLYVWLYIYIYWTCTSKEYIKVPYNIHLCVEITKPYISTLSMKSVWNCSHNISGMRWSFDDKEIEEVSEYDCIIFIPLVIVYKFKM